MNYYYLYFRRKLSLIFLLALAYFPYFPNAYAMEAINVGDLRFQADVYEHLGAQFSMGNIYYHGNGAPQNFKEAFKYYKIAADRGYEEAQVKVGDMYRKGEGIPQDFTKAFHYYKTAADAGDSTAQYELGNRYRNGEGVDKNTQEAFNFYTLAAKAGLTVAQNKLKEIAKSDGFKANESFLKRTIFEDYKNTMSQDLSNPPQVIMGDRYLKLGATQGNADAQFFLENINRYSAIDSENSKLGCDLTDCQKKPLKVSVDLSGLEIAPQSSKSILNNDIDPNPQIMVKQNNLLKQMEEEQKFLPR